MTTSSPSESSGPSVGTDASSTSCTCPDEEGYSPADGCPTHDPILVVEFIPAPKEDDGW